MTENASNEIDPGHYRRVLGQYPTGVCVVTGLDSDAKPVGMAVGSFTSLSLDPPLVAFMIDRKSSTWPRMKDAGVFCINVLSADQEDVCRVFATKGIDKFAQVRWEPASSNSPILDGAVAWIDCDLHRVEHGGDHEIVIGRVRDMATLSSSLPLLFFRGGYGRFSPLSMAAADEYLASRLALLDVARTGMEEVAQLFSGQVVAFSLVGESVVTVASAGELAPGSTWSMVGQRVAAVPPSGSPIIAWSGPDRVEWWLRNVTSSVDRVLFLARLAEVRARGYSVMVEGSEIGALMKWIDNRDFPPSLDELTTEQRTALENVSLDPLSFDPEDANSVRSVYVPVVSPTGDVPLAFGLRFRTPPSNSQELTFAAESLRTLSATVVSEIEGRHLKSSPSTLG